MNLSAKSRIVRSWWETVSRDLGGQRDADAGPGAPSIISELRAAPAIAISLFHRPSRTQHYPPEYNSPLLRRIHQHILHIMDKLVAQYSRPPHQNEFYSEQEQRDLTESLPPLSLKFNLPPVDNVRYTPLENSCPRIRFWKSYSCLRPA